MGETNQTTPNESGKHAPASASAPVPQAKPPSPAKKPAAQPASGAGGPQSIAVRGYPESVTRLIDELAKLPGIGRRSAERLAFHILKSHKPEALALAKAIEDVKLRVRHCRVCYNLADGARQTDGPAATEPESGSRLCALCFGATLNPPTRDASVVMVVEQPKDLIALEQTGMYKGVYHVLMGRISPLEGVGAGDLTVQDLLERLDKPSLNAGGVVVQEVVLALNPTMEGDGTALYLQEQLARRNIRLTRLARGLPTGSQLEYASKAVLADAIQGRRGV
jgi:recombination protein RecR